MRKIRSPEIAVFVILLFTCIGLSYLTVRIALWSVPFGDFRGVVLAAALVLALYCWALLAYRLVLQVLPMKEGAIEPGSKGEFGYHIHLLFNLVLFYPVTFSHIVPVPLMRLFYLAMGAKLGANTYSSGTILDPCLVRVGSNCIIGQAALVVPHLLTGQRLEHHAVDVGNDVTVGARAIILCGTRIGSGAIIAAGAVVAPFSQIGDGETWAGVPARRVDRART